VSKELEGGKVWTEESHSKNPSGENKKEAGFRTDERTTKREYIPARNQSTAIRTRLSIDTMHHLFCTGFDHEDTIFGIHQL